MYAITIQSHHYTGTFGADNRELLLLAWPDRTGMVPPDPKAPAAPDYTSPDPLAYATRADAAAEIDRIDRESGRRRLGPGEYATPTYRVVKVETKRYEQLYRRTFGGADPVPPAAKGADFVCGTRRVIPNTGRRLGTWRVVCATCGAGGTVQHPSHDNATRAAVRDSNKPCSACGAS